MRRGLQAGGRGLSLSLAAAHAVLRGSTIGSSGHSMLTRNDQSRDASELFLRTHFYGLDSWNARQRAHVLTEAPLQRQHANAKRRLLIGHG